MTQTDNNLLSLLVAALEGEEAAIKVVPDLLKEHGHQRSGQLLSEFFVATKKLALACEVYEKLFQSCDSFEEQNIGSDLAYLLGAILKDGVCCWPTNRRFIQKLRQIYNKSHPIWHFIEVSE